MAKRITIDPITRIEGHLRIDVQINDNNIVDDSWSSVQMFRGIETILRGSDPASAWSLAQRFCGVCTTTHALGSIRCVEDALNVEIPFNAQMLRNLVLTIQALQDHIVHFYHLTALDWIDIVSATKADPIKAGKIAEGLSGWPKNSINDMKEAKDKLTAFVSTGNLGIYNAGYWGHKDMRLSPEINLMAFSHYLQALDAQRQASQAVAIIGGKNPHIQNLCVGGVSTQLNMDGYTGLNIEKIDWLGDIINTVDKFINQVYVPDVLAIGGIYKDWFNMGKCSKNYISTPDIPLDGKASKFAIKGGVIQGDYIKEFVDWKDTDLRTKITETSAHAWYKENEPLHPYVGEQTPNYTDFEDDGKYTWCKAPRYDGNVTQTGPVAQIMVNYKLGHPATVKYVDYVRSKLGLSVEQLNSTMGRNAARAIRTLIMVENAKECYQLLIDNYGSGDTAYNNPTQIPSGEYKGVGFNEAPRGMLSHWVVIEDKLIKNYEAVVPSTWVASPRDNENKKGPYEESLMKLNVADPNNPLEVVRTIHSFDPCIACAVHTVDEKGVEFVKVKVR